MRTTLTVSGLAQAASIAFLGLAGCGGNSGPTVTMPAAASAPAAHPPPAPEVPATQTQATAAALSPAQERKAEPAGEPALSSMMVAESPQKLGAPVELRYQFDSDVRAGQPVTLHLAAVPRIPGSNLVVSIKKESGISTTAGDLTALKASASTAYRQELSVTKLAGGPPDLHVLVMMETPAGSSHSWFTVPLDASAAAAKQQPK